MVLRYLLKREFAYQTFIETIAGNHSEWELKSVMDLSITACLRLRRRKTTGFLRYPAIFFNKQWLIIRILCPHETHTLHAYSLAPSRK